MTCEEAISRLKRMQTERPFESLEELWQPSELTMAIEALEKQIARTPKGDFGSVPHYRCPACDGSVKLMDGDFVYPCCGWCGQKLDWR